MPTGYTTTGALADSLPTVIASARQVRENVGVMTNKNVVTVVNLSEGTGTAWNEISFAKLTAQAVTATTKLENPQQISDTLFSITPSIIGIHTFITDKVRRNLAPAAFAKIGGLVQNAVQRKKDIDGTVVLDGATTSLCGAGVTLASGYLSAAASRIKANATENGPEPINAVLHGYQMKDIHDELIAGVGTYNVGPGITASAFQDGTPKGKIGGVTLYEDNNIAIDSSDDVKGGVFSKEAVVLVQGKVPWIETRREPDIGGGGDSLFHYDEYAYGEKSAGNWLYEIYSDATAPTS